MKTTKKTGYVPKSKRKGGMVGVYEQPELKDSEIIRSSKSKTKKTKKRK